MTTLARLNSTIPESLNKFAETRVESGNFGNKSEYIRHLIRQDLEATRQSEIDHLNRRLERSMASGLSKKTPAQIKKEMGRTIKKAATSSDK